MQRISTISQNDTAPIAHTIASAQQRSLLGRSTLYAAMRTGALKSLKIGARRLILDEDLRAWLLAHRQG